MAGKVQRVQMEVRAWIRRGCKAVIKPLRKVAPFIDCFDIAFGGVLIIVLVLGSLEYLADIFQLFLSLINLSSDVPDIISVLQIEARSVLALVTAFTASIALYRLRHRPDKERPAVREEFQQREDSEQIDFGLRNYGPGPALYLQAVVTVEEEKKREVPVLYLKPHERPIHLDEGEFIGLVRGLGEVVHEEEKDGLRNKIQDGCDNDDSREVRLYYSFVSQTGFREPVGVFTEREDEDIVSEPDGQSEEGGPRLIEDQRGSDIRRIKLSKLEKCLNTTSD